MSEWHTLTTIEHRHQALLTALRALEAELRERGRTDVEDTTTEMADRLAALVKEHGG